MVKDREINGVRKLKKKTTEEITWPENNTVVE
jgi:hypothetical protein